MAGEEEQKTVAEEGKGQEVVPDKVVPPPPPSEDEATRLRAELEQSKQRQTGWDRAMGRLLERQEKVDRRLDQLLGLMSKGDASPALLKRFQNLELEMAQTKDLIQAQQGVTEEGSTVLSYEQKLLQQRQAEEATEKQRWDAQVATTSEAIEDDLKEAGVPLSALSGDTQFMSLWSAGQLREARQRAKAFVSNLKGGAKPPPAATAEPVETEPERIERLTNERLQAELRKRGLLLNDQGGGGSNKTWDDVRMHFGENPDDKENTALYYKMRREKGI